MPSLIDRVTSLITGIKTETKALRTMLTGTNNGTVAGLTTTATSVVGAINEVKTLAEAAGTVTQTDLDNSAAAVKADILGTAGPTVDTLKEIADLLSSNTTGDAALAVVVGNKANSSDVYTQAQFGNPDTDLLAIWNAA